MNRQHSKVDFPAKDVSLEYLDSDEFLGRAGVVTLAKPLRRALHRLPEIRVLRTRIAGGFISQQEVRKYVDRLYRDFQRNQPFPHETQLAALAVALEPLGGDFAEEYLLDLARLRVAEMSVAPEVARECSRQRYTLPRSKVRQKQFTTRNRQTLFTEVVSRNLSGRVSFHKFETTWNQGHAGA